MSVLQRHWDLRAAANFICGGAGSGLLLTAALIPDPAPGMVMTALALIAAGLASVWLEIGRKLRAVHVFFNPFTSWMTRESFAAVMVFLLGGSYLFFPQTVLLYGAGLAAAGFLYCQGRILRAAKGIPAWRVPQVVALIVCTGLVEGAGLALFFFSASLLLGAFTLALGARLVAWQSYREATGALERLDRPLLWLGTVLPAALIAVSPLLPEAATLAGAMALALGAWLKLALVTRASFKQDFSLPHLPVRGAR
jgi:phenylacetyl-CoA:acceptor oxidoreductase subunit 2